MLQRAVHVAQEAVVDMGTGILATNGRMVEAWAIAYAAAGSDIRRIVSSVVGRGCDTHGS